MSMEIPTEFVVRLANEDASDDIELLLNMFGVENAGGVIGEQIVRCRDCLYMSDDGLTTAWCNENCREVRPRDFCVWGERKSELDLIKEGIEYAKATYPNTMRLLEDE